MMHIILKRNELMIMTQYVHDLLPITVLNRGCIMYVSECILCILDIIIKSMHHAQGNDCDCCWQG